MTRLLFWLLLKAATTITGVQAWYQPTHSIPTIGKIASSSASCAKTTSLMLRTVVFSKQLSDDDDATELTKLVMETTGLNNDGDDTKEKPVLFNNDKRNKSPSTINEQPNPLILGTAILIGSILGLGLHLTPFTGALTDMFGLTVALHWALWAWANPPLALAFDFICISDLLYESTMRVNV